MTIFATTDGRNNYDPVVVTGYDIASAYDDELVVLYVLPRNEYEERWKDSDYTADDGRADARETAQRVVEGTLDAQENVTPAGRIGDPAEEILKDEAKRSARYIVIAGRKRSSAGKALFGSVTQSVILRTDTSIVAVSR